MCSSSSANTIADSIAGSRQNNDEEIYAEEVVEDEGGSEPVIVPRTEVRVTEWNGGTIIGLIMYDHLIVENVIKSESILSCCEATAHCIPTEDEVYTAGHYQPVDDDP